MNDPELMGLFQNVANLNSNLTARSAENDHHAQGLPKCRTLDELHDDEVTTVRQVAGVEDHRRVRMAQPRHRARLTQEAIGDIAVARKLRFDYFDGYGTFESEMRRSIYRAHAARSDFTFDTEPAGDKLRDIHI